VETAQAAGLVISADCYPGIRRLGSPGAFRYRRDDGRPPTRADRARIERLKIPPAWTDVWICADGQGHLQATGRDARGRKQYRYHEQWRVTRDETKFGRMITFGEALPEIRRRVDADLRRPTPDRARVLALVVAVLDETLIRVGNSAYARDNESFGLTTLRDEHAEIGSVRVRLRFRGKAGKELHAEISNPRIARALSRTRELPGQELFQYVDDIGETRVVGSGDVNAYLREAGGSGHTSKDFRTWGGSLAFALAALETADMPSERGAAAALREAASVLGNTPAVCRRSYIHPGLLETYLRGGLTPAWQHAWASQPRRPYLRDEERAFLGLLNSISG
jgi:DNA topoisomerase-1